MTRLASSGAGPTRTAAEVSSHDVSMPGTTSATAGPPPHGDRIGGSVGADPPRRDNGEAGDAPGRRARRAARDVGNHAHAVAGKRVHPLLRPAHCYGDP